jgi:hypothetical protein
LVPEFEPKPEEIMRAFRKSWKQGKPHFIVVAAEGMPLSAEEFLCWGMSSGAGAPRPSTRRPSIFVPICRENAEQD